jgi:uncharacterized protein (TIGR02145 family)
MPLGFPPLVIERSRNMAGVRGWKKIKNKFNFTLILISKTKNTMKKVFLAFGLLLAIGAATAQNDKGVVINGIKWAKYNVGEENTFVSSPQEYGNYYTFDEAQNACPAGWRIPTRGELKTLLDEEKVTSEWTTQNDVTGRLFTDKTTNSSLFLPAAGRRNGSDGTLSHRGNYGFCWSSTADGTNGYSLGFSSSAQYTFNLNRSNGFSVRCIAE